MSQVLYALVVLQGTTLNLSPGYTSVAACTQQYKGPYVSCFAYDPNLSTWTAFFKLPEGGFRTVGKIASEDECKRYIGAFKDGIPTACRQLAMPVTCNVACVAPVQPPAIPPKVGGKQYTKVAGLTWVESTDSSRLRPSSFADVSVGPNDLQSKDKPTPLPPKVQTARAEAPQRPAGYAPQQYAQHPPEPFRALIDVVMLPFDFLSYPARRDW
jgi:uncharacterized protein YbdZ (MbtH family)